MHKLNQIIFPQSDSIMITGEYRLTKLWFYVPHDTK